jgi:sec-independent protein translocase protein TatB
MLPEVGATELLVIAAIALIVVGPKDLPILMRKVGRFVAQMRSMAAEFRSSFDELARQSELEELRREVEAMRAAANQPASYAAAQMGLADVQSDIGSSLAEKAEPELPLSQPAKAAAPDAEPELPLDPHAPHESEPRAAEPREPQA